MENTVLKINATGAVGTVIIVFEKVLTAAGELGNFANKFSLIKDFEWKKVISLDIHYSSNDIIQIYKTETTINNVLQSPIVTLRLQIATTLKLAHTVDEF